jgi:hypothetical protein
METYLRFIGDGLSIAALAIIFSTSLRAQKKIKPQARVPLSFDRRGEPAARSSKGLAIWALPVLALVLLYAPTAAGLTLTLEDDEAIMLFCMRAIISAALALRHIVHMQKVFELMDEEGQLLS